MNKQLKHGQLIRLKNNAAGWCIIWDLIFDRPSKRSVGEIGTLVRTFTAKEQRKHYIVDNDALLMPRRCVLLIGDRLFHTPPDMIEPI